MLLQHLTNSDLPWPQLVPRSLKNIFPFSSLTHTHSQCCFSFSQSANWFANRNKNKTAHKLSQAKCSKAPASVTTFCPPYPLPPPPFPVATTRPYSSREYASLLQWKQKAICKFSIAHKSMLWKFFPMTFRLTFSFSFSISLFSSRLFSIFLLLFFSRLHCVSAVFFFALFMKPNY